MHFVGWVPVHFVGRGFGCRCRCSVRDAGRVLGFAFTTFFLFFPVRPVFAADELDPGLKPDEMVETNTINDVFKDVVVVQRKAKDKAGRALFYSYGSFDFSDGPTTMYGINLNAGYAISDHWEIYANFVPAFLSQERDLAKQIRDLPLRDGGTAAIAYAVPKTQYGLELLWAPAYGKDSWGPYSIVRSDTFFKLGAGVIQYDVGTGQRYNATVGKTFFLSRFFNLRISAGGSYLESIVNERKKFYFVGIIETGLIWYL